MLKASISYSKNAVASPVVMRAYAISGRAFFCTSVFMRLLTSDVFMTFHDSDGR